MPKSNNAILAFNRGIISPLALARVDLDRLRLSAETQTNWMPRVLGSMALRPGLEYTGSRRVNAQSLSIPFIFAADDLAEIEITENTMRIWVDDVQVGRVAVSSVVNNGDFNTDLTGWTDDDDPGAVSAHQAGGFMSLLGTGTAEAKRYQEVAVSASDQNIMHGLRVFIERGPVVIKIGTSAGDDTYFNAALKTGVHSLALTPTGNFFIQFSNILPYKTLVDSVNVEGAGSIEIPTPWAATDLASLRYDQSADVVFVASDGFQTRRIERRINGSWSVVLFDPVDGPFLGINSTTTTLAPSSLTGDITLTASRDLFEPEHVGALFRISSQGQVVSASIVAEDTFTGSILVTGVGEGRAFNISVVGTWVATVTLQRSVDDATWVDVESYTTNTNKNFNDGQNNVEYYYRIGVKTGGYTSGTVGPSLSYSGGTLTGVCRVTGFTSSTVVDAIVLSPLGGTDPVDTWYEGVWSDLRGYPTALALYEGRLWLAGRSRIIGSASDAFESFDDFIEGDSGPINRVIGQGPVDTIHWLGPVQRLMIGTTSAEISARSTSFDEPLTPTNFNLKDADTEGVAAVSPVKDGSRLIYVQKSGTKIYQLQYTIENNDYAAADLSELVPELGEPSIVRLAIQRQPDTRVHCVRSDGRVAILVKDSGENTLAWMLFETDGQVEDAYVFPGEVEDQVYYTVQRTRLGQVVRNREKWTLESEGRGGTTNKLLDSHVFYSGPATSTLDGLIHLEGETVNIWGNGKDLGSAVVSGNQVTTPEPVTTACVGLPYTATYKSTKLAYSAGLGTALNQVKKVNQVGIIARDVHASGLQMGPDDSTLYDLPRYKDGQIVDPNTVSIEYDQPTFEFGGEWDSDSRLFLRAQAPKPVTLLAAVLSIQTNDKV